MLTDWNTNIILPKCTPQGLKPLAIQTINNI